MSQFERTPCKTNVPALRVTLEEQSEAEVVWPDQWRHERLPTTEAQEAAAERRLREELARERADKLYRRSQLPWPLRLILGAWDVWCDWRNGRRP